MRQRLVTRAYGLMEIEIPEEPEIASVTPLFNAAKEIVRAD